MWLFLLLFCFVFYWVYPGFPKKVRVWSYWREHGGHTSGHFTEYSTPSHLHTQPLSPQEVKRATSHFVVHDWMLKGHLYRPGTDICNFYELRAARSVSFPGDSNSPVSSSHSALTFCLLLVLLSSTAFLALTSRHHHAQLLRGCWGSNSASHACMTSTYQPSDQLSFTFFLSWHVINVALMSEVKSAQV